jgi:hypothetical protein
MAVNCGCEIQDSKQSVVLRCDKLLVFHGKIKGSHDDLNKDRYKPIIKPHLI